MTDLARYRARLQDWLALERLIRSILRRRWDETTWPPVRAELRKALWLRARLAKGPLWN